MGSETGALLALFQSWHSCNWTKPRCRLLPGTCQLHTWNKYIKVCPVLAATNFRYFVPIDINFFSSAKATTHFFALLWHQNSPATSTQIDCPLQNQNSKPLPPCAVTRPVHPRLLLWRHQCTPGCPASCSSLVALPVSSGARDKQQNSIRKESFLGWDGAPGNNPHTAVPSAIS